MRPSALALSLGLLTPSSLLAASPSQSDGEALVAQSVRYHDPHGVWGRRALKLTWTGSNPDGARRLHVNLAFDRDGAFALTGTYKGHALDYALSPDGQRRATVDGEDAESLSAEVRTKLVLDREQGRFWRNYFGFLAGVPMNLQAEGVIIGQDVVPTTFGRLPARAVEVRFTPEVGTDVWAFFFHISTGALLGCQFTKADPKKGGEYIVFEGTVKADGLQLPRERRWYVNDKNTFLGVDTLSELKLGP